MNVLNVVPMRPSTIPPPRDAAHVSVLRTEVVAALTPRMGARYVDATLGGGGHAAALLATPGVEVIGMDRDRSALGHARKRLAEFGSRVSFHHRPFSEMRDLLDELGIAGVDGVVADLGISSFQLDDADRGMSFRGSGPLDMRMDRSTGETAAELIERLSVDELADLIHKLGEERRSRRVARCIKQAASRQRLGGTFDLRRAVVRAVGPARVGGVDPATRTFLALRVAVNAELVELEAMLRTAADCVVPDGRLAVIAFHSLEDRIVKRVLRRAAEWQPLTKKPVTPGVDELEVNPRARSAKLRVALRVAAAEDVQ